jgi:hypothetical protein
VSNGVLVGVVDTSSDYVLKKGPAVEDQIEINVEVDSDVDVVAEGNLEVNVNVTSSGSMETGRHHTVMVA